MKIALVGYGRMGRAVEAAATASGHEVVARLGRRDLEKVAGLTLEQLSGAEVAIEFTVADAAPDNIRALAAAGVDAVVGTTGWYDGLADVKGAVEEAGTAMIYAPNFSLGTQLFFRLARLAGQLAERLEEYDPYIVESHHRHKKDHPSGTARKLAEILLAELSRKASWTLGTSGEGALDPSLLQVTAIRAGEIPGTHVLGLEGPDDRIELSHEARGRAGFARGAVAAAQWVHGRKGVFTLEEMLAEKWS